MTSLELSNIELVSTLRAVPANGAPSSADYTDSQREALQDFASLADLLNTNIVPLVNSLVFPAGTSPAPSLSGDTLLASADTENPLFVNSITGEPFTIAQVFLQLSAVTVAQAKTLLAQQGAIRQLQSQLASTNQVDISKALQGLSDQVRTLQNQVNTLLASGQ